MKNILYILLLFWVFACGEGQNNHKENLPETLKSKNAPKVIGFYKGTLEEVNKYEVEKLTHIVFCFADV